ncbi:MAG: hypothetical protein FWC91_01190 [Defluviitaleaceae bacterium]|nr:hypothetical protein [Defluviitaleaceae bacterium]
MSLASEINDICNNKLNGTSFYEDSDLVKEYQALLDKGLVKKRGFTLQTIEEKQKDEAEVKIIYNTSAKKFKHY